MAKGRVLLAHGNADCRKIYGSVLTFEGYDLDVVANGDEALRLLATVRFDVVVTDLYLPSAIDECVVRQVRASASGSHLPVVVITGWTTEMHRRVAFNEGTDAFLPLPVTPRELASVVAGLLAQPRALLSTVPTAGTRSDWTIASGF